MAEVTISDVGFAEVSVSALSAQQTGIIAAALDDGGTYDAGAVLPLPWHWSHFTPRATTSDLGVDGHPPTPAHLHAAYPRRMWAGGSFDAPGRLVIGEPAERESRVTNQKTSEGKSGPLLIVTVEHTYRQRGEVQIVETQSLVYRAQGDPVRMPEGEELPDASTGSDSWVDRRQPSSVELFRFSAITFNTHRIHYDDAYARDEEGYPALVVHGPLTATRVIMSIERHTGLRLASFAYRATAPLFVDRPLAIAGTVDGDEVSVRVLRNDGATSMEASGVLAAQ
jgi:3-methylfumaryl-CoA hydratase